MLCCRFCRTVRIVRPVADVVVTQAFRMLRVPLTGRVDRKGNEDAIRRTAPASKNKRRKNPNKVNSVCPCRDYALVNACFARLVYQNAF